MAIEMASYKFFYVEDTVLVYVFVSINQVFLHDICMFCVVMCDWEQC